MHTLFDAIRSFLAGESIDYKVVGDPPAAQAIVDGEHGQWVTLLAAREDDAQLLVYSICPLKAPARRRSEAAEFVARANYGLVLGNFELDFEDGEVRFKTSLDLSGVADDQRPAQAGQQLSALLYANLAMMDQHLPGFAAVIGGDTPAAAAIADIDLARLEPPR